MNMCANLKAYNPPDKQTYYWGILFKPQDPVIEKVWDGVTFQTVFNKATTNATQHVARDVWVDQRNATKSNLTNSTAYEINGLPNVPYYGGKVANIYYDQQNDWLLNTDYSWVSCNASSSVCEF